jgi:hypothetical protein
MLMSIPKATLENRAIATATDMLGYRLRRAGNECRMQEEKALVACVPKTKTLFDVTVPTTCPPDNRIVKYICRVAGKQGQTFRGISCNRL